MRTLSDFLYSVIAVTTRTNAQHLFQDRDNSARLVVAQAGAAKRTERIASDMPGAALMFEDMAAAAADPSLRAGWAERTRRTQALLDAIWNVGRAAEVSVI